MSAVRAVQAFTTYIESKGADGTSTRVRCAVAEGAMYDSSDPLVKAHPDQFDAPETATRKPAVVEQATAAPGEKRSTTRVAKA